MSLQKLPFDMTEFSNSHYLKITKKFNELVDEAKDSLQADLALRNEITDLRKEVADMKKQLSQFHTALMNRG